MDHEGRTGYSKESCLPLSAYSIAVEGALAQLARWRTVPASSSSYPIQNSSPTKHVLVSTDSTDPDLLASVQAKGWKIVTKELSDRIRAQEGDWMPTLIDTVLMSLGRSFVGTADSMSKCCSCPCQVSMEQQLTIAVAGFAAFLPQCPT